MPQYSAGNFKLGHYPRGNTSPDESLLMRQGIYYDGGAAMPRVPRSKQLMAE
jgi:hypothetical protein